MIKGYRDFYYNVTDMNRAIQFYTDALGMKKARRFRAWFGLEDEQKVI